MATLYHIGRHLSLTYQVAAQQGGPHFEIPGQLPLPKLLLSQTAPTKRSNETMRSLSAFVRWHLRSSEEKDVTTTTTAVKNGEIPHPRDQSPRREFPSSGFDL